MAGSAVPPCRTITFAGGQFVAPSVPVPVLEFAALGERELWPEDAGALQFDARTFFLCRRRRFFGECEFCPEEGLAATPDGG